MQLLKKDERIHVLEKELAPAIELIDEAQGKIKVLEAKNRELKEEKKELEKKIQALLD